MAFNALSRVYAESTDIPVTQRVMSVIREEEGNFKPGGNQNDVAGRVEAVAMRAKEAAVSTLTERLRELRDEYERSRDRDAIGSLAAMERSRARVAAMGNDEIETLARGVIRDEARSLSPHEVDLVSARLLAVDSQLREQFETVVTERRLRRPWTFDTEEGAVIVGELEDLESLGPAEVSIVPTGETLRQHIHVRNLIDFEGALRSG